MEEPRFTSFQATVAESYDHMFRPGSFLMDDHAESGFANLGLFLPGTKDYTAACENLMERLVGLIRRRQGRVLDVACGMGGPTRYLTRYYPPYQVHAVNISAHQLEICRGRVPGAHFHLMAAEQLEFPEGSFDTVVSVDAAAHFKGRKEFLKGAYRVLKPGGELVVADTLFHSQPRSFRDVLAEQELYRNIDEYRGLWEECGFQDVTCEDVTRPSLRGFVEYTRGRALRNLVTGRSDAATFRRLVRFADKLAGLPVTALVLAHASKPA